jgi:hypothetical protein
LGLLTKIFGNPEGGASTSGEPSASEPASSSAASTEDPVISSYPKGTGSSSGIRPTVEAPAQRPRESGRPNTASRRPEHPRMYLRPSPATLDPAVPGSTRRPQISVRPATRETTRSAPPPPKRAGLDPARGERPSRRGISVDLPYDLPSEPSSAPSSRPPASSKNALVVSPVSLTPEEVQLPPGTRPKMPTLLGLGAALETPPLPLVAPAGAVRAAKKAGLHKGSPASSAREANEGDAPKVDAAPTTEREAAVLEASVLEASVLEAPAGEAPELEAPAFEALPALGPALDAAFEGLTIPADFEAPDDITAPVQLLADFALKLSLGPVTRSWLSDVRRSANTLLVTGKHRHETALAALSDRLLALLPSAAGAAGEAAEATLGAAAPIDGDLRDQILHEVSRLAGVLPEWPAPAQDLAEEARRRETRIMRELLSVVDGFKRDQRARLEEQMRLEELSSMPAEAIAEEFEAPLERAEELRVVLEAYRRDRQTRPPDLGNALGLSRALRELVRTSDEFDDCDPELKEPQRLLRLERRRALTSVNLLLAERGEFEWLEQLEPLSIGERVERLEQWLDVSSERAN